MHIVNGDNAAQALSHTLHIPPQKFLICRDVLSCGPLTTFNDMTSWSNFRQKYWADMYQEHGFGTIDTVNEMPRNFYHHLDDLHTADQITLWMGCSLSDHLLMLFTIKLFNHYGLNFNKLTIRHYHKIPKKNITIIGIGVLSPEQLHALKPTPFTLTEEQITTCLGAWDAITAQTPNMLMHILNTPPSTLPLLHKALQNLFYRYPNSTHGLSRFDEIILQATQKHSPNTARIIGYTLGYDMHLDDDNIHALDTVGDIYLLHRLKNLANPHLPSPLISLNIMNASLQETKTTLTPFGLKALTGKHNVIHTNGINDWVAGVQLNSTTGKIYVRQGNTLVLSTL